MAKTVKLEENQSSTISVTIIDKPNAFRLDKDFYRRLYEGVFIDPQNNLKAGLKNMDSKEQVSKQIKEWFRGNVPVMFFLIEKTPNGEDIVGTVQAFTPEGFDKDKTLSLGYIIGPSFQKRGLGTKLVKFATEYLHDKGFNIILGIRDGNIASEKTALKIGYEYHYRTLTKDVEDISRPMNYYKYFKKTLTESVNNYKTMLTQQWIEDNNKIITRVNPRAMTLDEYIYHCNSYGKPKALNESYYLYTSLDFDVVDKLKKKKINCNTVALTDNKSRELFNPEKNGDIKTWKLVKLSESKLDVLENNDTHVILGNEYGEIKAKITKDVLLVEEFIINN